ncbi:PE family protein [Mycobacterium haemophilum DSM 44634]|uniref:PE family protein n=1 Tax=Mycobacterium haemophilum TaxID=29311 RepID=UPI0006562137|nr:PE family protein [Mycobacterium haemophilum]AKN18131.1 hypothetical protein B586_18635 [Mycobacterium haemophilum DSM 44634]MCV7340959.1 PE family protein [Mycobacterium haemophilum DSM 44634]
MSFLTTAPEALENAAAEVRKMSADAAAVYAAADPVITAVVAPAPDPNSQWVAAHLVGHAQRFAEVFAAARVVFEELAVALDAGAQKYAATEADNVKPLS